MKKKTIILLYILIFSFNSSIVAAATFYCDPVAGNTSTGDGSAETPWGTLESVIDANKIESYKTATSPYDGTLTIKNEGAPVSAGDTLILKDGNHGNIYFREYFNSDWIVIKAADGETPVLTRFRIYGGTRFRLEGITINCATYDPLFSTAEGIIYLTNNNNTGPTTRIVIDGCTVKSTDDISGWDADDWDTYARTGLRSNGTSVDSITVHNCTFDNVRQGIVLTADSSTISHNTITDLMGDGIFLGGNNNMVENNTVHDWYVVNADHLDGIQLFNVYDEEGGNNNSIFRNNYILEHSLSREDTLALGGVQGIGSFGPPNTYLEVYNNIIISSAFSGISINTAQNCEIINNTVVPSGLNDGREPCIRIANRETYEEDPHDNIIQNNIAPRFEIYEGEGDTYSKNIKINDYGYTAIFSDPDTYDFTLNSSSPAINAGDNTNAPPFDFTGEENSRIKYSIVDAGAFESNYPTPGPPEIEWVRINPENGWAKIGDPITITVKDVKNRTGLTVSDATINGKTVPLSEQGNGIYGGTYTVIQNDYDGINVEATDITLTNFFGTTDPSSSSGSTLRIDAHRPGIQSVIISPHSGTVTINDRVNITVTATNNETGLTPSHATINGKSISLTGQGNGTYTGTYVVQQGDPGGVNINATGITLTDAAGNVSTPGASTGSTLSVVDTNPTSSPPVIQSIDIEPNSGWSKIGSSITITATAENNITGLTASNALINEKSISLTDQGNGTYRGTYTVTEGDNDGVNVEATNITLTGPGGTSDPASSSGSTLRIDAHKPVIQSVAVSPNYGTVTTGNTVTISVTAQGHETGLISSNAMFNGKSIPLTDQNNGTYVGYYTVQSGDPQGTNLNATGITLRDAAGNVSSSGSSSGSTLSVVFIVQPPPPPPAPIIQSVKIIPNAGYAKVGTPITITVTAANNQSGLSASKAQINGREITLTDQGDGTYKGTYTVLEGDEDGVNVEATNVTLTGPGGTSNPAQSTGSTLRIDAHTPYIPMVSINPSSGTITTGDTVEITAITTEGTSVLYASPAKINGKTIPLVNQGYGTFKGVYTVQQGDPEGIYIEATDVKLTDTAGNVSFPGKSSGSSLRVIDTENPAPGNVPKISSVTINPDSGYVSLGDSVTITVVAENNVAGLIPSDALFNGENIQLSDIGGGKYSGIYKVMEGDREGANVEATDITLSNTNGASEPMSSDGSQLIIDARAPVVQSVTVFPMGGTVRNGDNVTITARAANNETGLFPSPAQFNGRSVVLIDQGDGTYKGIYTVKASDPQGMNVNATGITLTDAAGNTSVPRSSTGSTLRISLLPPAVPTVTIKPNSGIAAVGDTITITVTAADKSSGLIPSPVLMNDKQVTLTDNGDGTYTGIYIVTASDNSGFNVEATSITLTGGGGTSAPASSEESTLIIDFEKPVISSVNIYPSSGWVTAGDSVYIRVTAVGNETGLTPSNALINQKSIPLADNGDGTYRGVYVVQSGDEQGGPVAATGITLTDVAGNTSQPKSSSGSQLKVDTVIPKIVDIKVETAEMRKIAGDTEIPKVASAGDTIFVTVYALNNETNLIPSNARIGTISFPIIDRHNNGTYYGTYTVNQNDPYIENIIVSNVTLTDTAGNESPAFSSGETGISFIPDPVLYACDFNKDGFVNIYDYTLFSTHYGTKEGDPGYDISYDISDKKGSIDYTDFSIFASKYNLSSKIAAAKIALTSQVIEGRPSDIGINLSYHENTIESEYTVFVNFKGHDIIQGFEFSLSYNPVALELMDKGIEGLTGITIPSFEEGTIRLASLFDSQDFKGTISFKFKRNNSGASDAISLTNSTIVTQSGIWDYDDVSSIAQGAPGTVQTITDLAVVKSSERFVSLSWTAPAASDGTSPVEAYLIEMSQVAPNNEVLNRTGRIELTNTPQAPGIREEVIIKGLEPGLPYHFSVKSSDKNFKVSEPSNIVSTRTLISFVDDDLDPNDPYIIRGSDSLFIADNDRNITFEWSSWETLGAASYTVRVSDETLATIIGTETILETKYIVNGNPDHTYKIEVTPTNQRSEPLGIIQSRAILCADQKIPAPGIPKIVNSSE